MSHGTTTDAGMTVKYNGLSAIDAAYVRARNHPTVPSELMIDALDDMLARTQKLMTQCDAARAELARVTALREAFDHLDQYAWVSLFDSLLGEIQERAGTIAHVDVDDGAVAARISELCDAWWSGQYVAQASERAAGNGEAADGR